MSGVRVPQCPRYGGTETPADRTEFDQYYQDMMAKAGAKTPRIAEGYVALGMSGIHYAPGLTENGGPRIGGMRLATVPEVKAFYKEQGTEPPAPVKSVPKGK